MLSLDSPELHKLVQPLRRPDNATNWLYLAIDYASLIVVMGGTIAFCQMHQEWGFSSFWLAPVVLAAVCLVGALQHRLAGLGHEGAHYILFRNRKLNEAASDLLCMFPLFSTTEQYRQIHLGHHEYVNDWERDPELLNLGHTRMMDRFPMTKREFLYHFTVALLIPKRLLRYMWDNIYVTAVGNGVHPYNLPAGQGPPLLFGLFRITSVLGIGYLAVMIVLMGYLSHFGTTFSMTATPLAMLAVAGACIWALPIQWFFSSRIRPVYSNKITSFLRLSYLTAMECVLAWSFFLTGFEWGVYFWLLWMLPLFTVFPYLMLLRDLFQHANADDGRLSNSRAILCHPVLRWAMFIYGQDLHVTHHLFPFVPHFRLPALHRLLMAKCDEYSREVVETQGLLRGNRALPTLLDVIAPKANAGH
ncbi:MAG: fatty acid desaturase [Planctomycetia bacterium]|nr:fatty acid desaturase [Planctomycetia bacterium]